MSGYFRIVIFFCFPFLVFGQGYYNSENFGNRSMLLGGNVTGSVEDLGLTYYNPARIALIEDPVFSINAKAYQYNTADLKNAFGRETKLSDSRYEGVPSMVAGTYKIEKWPKHHFAYSFLSKQRSKIGIDVSRVLDSEELIDENEELQRFVGNFKLNGNKTDEWFGMSWGMKLKDNLSIGASVFASIYSNNSTYALGLATLGEISGVNLFNSEIKYGQISYGLFFKAGLAWNVKKVELGLNIDMPYLEIVKSGKFRYQRYLSGTEGGNDDFKYYDFEDLDAQRKEPVGISIGAGIPIRRHKLHLKADWHGKVSAYERLVIPPINEDGEGFALVEEMRSVINIGAGIELYLNDYLNLYGSVSTDFSPVKSNATIFDLIEINKDSNFDVDFFHYAFGMNFKLKKVQVIVGGTYSTGSGDFGDPIEFPDPDVEIPVNTDPARLTLTRWRLLLGLEIPIFGYKLEVK